MTRSKLGLRTLALSGLVLCTTAFNATAAHAEKEANWRVNGTNVSSTLLPQLEISEIENKTASLSWTTKGGTGVLLLCTAAKFTEGGKLSANGGITLGRINFIGCSVLLNEVAAPKCHPHSFTKGELSGELLSEKFSGLTILDKEEKLIIINKEGKEEVIFDRISDLVKFTPDEGKILMVFLLGETCAIGETVSIEAQKNEETEEIEGLWLKDHGGNSGLTTEAVTHLVEEGLRKILALGQPASIIGSANLALTGEVHKGLKWSGKPS